MSGVGSMGECKFVEFWVPVQISNLQLEQYCGTLLSSAMALGSCSKTHTVGALNHLLISLRKCCDHPYILDPSLHNSIIKGLEPTMFLEVGIKASGKLQFLDLILPQIKQRQLRVLILFQPTGGMGRVGVGDILDDFIHQRFGQDSYERLEGIGVVPWKKQAALNNFNKDMSRFIFLLDHRLCKPTIKLSSVDIILVFNTDFNPANDLKALEKLSFHTQKQQIMVFRLYSLCTPEEEILRHAQQNATIDSNLQNLSRSACHALLMWGASDLFNKLTHFHSSSVVDISSQESFFKDVVEEFLYLISHKGKTMDAPKPIISRVQTCGHYDTKTQLLYGEQPHVFWKTLLEGRCPQWKFASVSTPRQRKRPHYFGDSSEETIAADGDGDADANAGEKHKKTWNNSFSKPTGMDQKESESEKVNRGWEEKRTLLEDDYKLDKALVRILYRSPSVRAEKLRSLDQEFAIRIKEHERMEESRLKDSKATLLVEVQSHAYDMVVPADNIVGIPNVMVDSSIRTEDPNGGRDEVNSKSLEMVGAMIQDLPKQGGSLDTYTNHVEADLIFEEVPGTAMEPSNKVSNSPNTGSHTSEEQVADAAVSSALMGEIPAQQHDGNDNMGHVESRVPEVDLDQENAKGGTSSPVALHAVEDGNPSDMALNVDSAEMGMPAGSCSKDASHAEDQNDSCGSSSSNSPSAAVSQDKTPLVEPFASSASDHIMPTIQEIQNESLQVQQLLCSGIQLGQTDPCSLADSDVDHVQPVDARLVDQINTLNSSHDELSFRLSAHLTIAENQSDILPANRLLLETTCEEPTLTCFPANSSDYSMLQSRGHSEEPLEERQPHLPSSGTAREQPNGALDNSRNPEIPAPSLDAEIPNQNHSQPVLNRSDVQGYDIHHQVALRMPNQGDPLQAELERLCAVRDNVIKVHEDTRQRLQSECEKEIAEMIAQINLKYEAKRQDAEAAFHSRKKELDINLHRVVMNKMLALAFRSMCQDGTTPSGQPAIQAGLPQQVHSLRAQPSVRRSPGIARPPLQIVHQPADLFSSRPPLNMPLYNAPSRPSLNIPLYSAPSRLPLNMPFYGAPTRLQPNVFPYSTCRPPLNINAINPSSTLPPGINSSTVSRAPPPGINLTTPSIEFLRASHNWPMVNMRASVSSEFRAPAPHIRSASMSPDFASHWMQHVNK